MGERRHYGRGERQFRVRLPLFALAAAAVAGLLAGSAGSSPASSSASSSSTVSGAQPWTDLALNLSAPATAAVSRPITYWLSAKNNGPNPSDAVKVDTEFSPGVQLSLPPDCHDLGTGTGPIVRCGPFDLGPGETRSFEVGAITPATPGTITATSALVGRGEDLDSSSNKAFVSTTVVARLVNVSLSLTQSASTDSTTVGGLVTFLTTARNDGPETAHLFTFSDPLPSALAFVSAAPGCSYAVGSRTVTCSVAPLGAGATAGLWFTTRAATAGVAENTAVMAPASDDVDLTTADDAATTRVAIAPTPGTATAEVALVGPATPVEVGATRTLTATVTESGAPVAGAPVTFQVLSGPNSGLSRIAQTDVAGAAVFVYASSTAGTDVVQATYVDAQGLKRTSNFFTALWLTSRSSAQGSLAATDADLEVTINGADYVRVGKTITFTVAVVNHGPGTASNINIVTPVPSGSTLVSALPSGGAGCTPSGCFMGGLPKGATATITLTLSAAAVGQLTLTSTASSDADPNPANDTARVTVPIIAASELPPPPTPPTETGTFNAVGLGGVVVNGVAKQEDKPFLIRANDVVNVADGVITFTDSNGNYGSWSAAELPVQGKRTEVEGIGTKTLPAQFRVEQVPGGSSRLVLVGGDFSGCASPRSLAASKKPIRQLWGSAKGNFVTKGRLSAATIRGTVWLVRDRCDGTLTQVLDGVVTVNDTTLKKTVTVTAGHSYLARATRGTFLPPAVQTTAAIRLHGLHWAGRTFATRAAFERWLKARGSSWKRFKAAYPALAAGLAGRG